MQIIDVNTGVLPLMNSVDISHAPQFFVEELPEGIRTSVVGRTETPHPLTRKAKIADALLVLLRCHAVPPFMDTAIMGKFVIYREFGRITLFG